MENKIHLDSIANKKTSFTSYRLIILSLIVVLFIFLMMGLSFVKLTNSGPVEGYDHAPRPSMEETELK